MASIRKRGSNSYLIVVSRGYDYEGNRLKSVQKTVKPPKEYTPKQAEKWVKEQAILFEREVQHSPEPINRSITLAKYIEHWAADVGPKKLADSTFRRDEQDIRRILPALGNYKLTDLRKEVIREFLTMDELLSIYHKEFSLERITVVRDVFIFAAFTGLAFIDVQQLSPEHIVKDNNENLWIRKPRQKTKNMCNIPLLDIPLEILRKYADYPACKKKGVLLPVPCNQKMNSYLKEIADLCLIKKNLTTHPARHSYATSVCLANGVSIENVAKMLGHSNIKMTQHYARVLDSSILKDMNNVRDILSNCL